MADAVIQARTKPAATAPRDAVHRPRRIDTMWVVSLNQVPVWDRTAPRMMAESAIDQGVSSHRKKPRYAPGPRERSNMKRSMTTEKAAANIEVTSRAANRRNGLVLSHQVRGTLRTKTG